MTLFSTKIYMDIFNKMGYNYQIFNKTIKR